MYTVHLSYKHILCVNYIITNEARHTTIVIRDDRRRCAYKFKKYYILCIRIIHRCMYTGSHYFLARIHSV